MLNNWFNQGGDLYANYRPQYPDSLLKYLLDLPVGKDLLLDVGCGSGQLTKSIAPYFKSAVGIDPSLSQLKNTITAKSFFVCASAESLPVKNNCADLIVVAQAAHWFDLDSFYRETERVLKYHGVLALISYGVLSLEPKLNDVFKKFYYQDIYSYWPPQRKIVDSAYADIDFPFAEQVPPKIKIEYYWDLNQFLGYISTWSAVKRMDTADQILNNFAHELAGLWGNPADKRLISWPINMRVGVVSTK